MRLRIAPAARFAARMSPAPPAPAAASAPGAWRRSLSALGRLVVGSVRNGGNAWMVRRAIESLQALDDRTLADIGMHRSEIEHAVRQQLTRDW
jgi:uncharacterized protein YjiS (DUF1127 family)